MKDFYYILGVEPNCSFDEIQSAYTKLSDKFRPDLNNGDKYFKSRFQEINDAYYTLGNPYNRQQYDRELNAFKFNNDQEQVIVTSTGGHSNSIGIGMTMVLILLALILGDYIFQYFRKPAPKKTKEIYAASIVADTAHKKHKRHHISENHIVKGSVTRRNRFSGNLDKQKQAKLPPVKTSVIKPVPEKPALVSKSIPVKYVAFKSLQDSSKSQPGKQNNGVFVYTTYVNPNATGVVNMRSLDTYGSQVIATIPPNSKVFVLKRGPAYYKVIFNSYTGYVPKWSLQTK